MRSSDSVHGRVSERWLILAVLFLARTAMGFQFQSVAALSPFLVDSLGIDYTQLGLLIGLYLLPGIAIAYPDLTHVLANTTLNQTNQPLEAIAILMGIYLTLSLATSLFMNWFNTRMALVER